MDNPLVIGKHAEEDCDPFDGDEELQSSEDQQERDLLTERIQLLFRSPQTPKPTKIAKKKPSSTAQILQLIVQSNQDIMQRIDANAKQQAQDKQDLRDQFEAQIQELEIRTADAARRGWGYTGDKDPSSEPSSTKQCSPVVDSSSVVPSTMTLAQSLTPIELNSPSFTQFTTLDYKDFRDRHIVYRNSGGRKDLMILMHPDVQQLSADRLDISHAEFVLLPSDQIFGRLDIALGVSIVTNAKQVVKSLAMTPCNEAKFSKKDVEVYVNAVTLLLVKNPGLTVLSAGGSDPKTFNLWFIEGIQPTRLQKMLLARGTKSFADAKKELVLQYVVYNSWQQTNAVMGTETYKKPYPPLQTKQPTTSSKSRNDEETVICEKCQKSDPSKPTHLSSALFIKNGQLENWQLIRHFKGRRYTK